MLDPFAQFFQHCWGHARSTLGLQRLMGCILSTMHYRSQTCWELLHPFAHHCQHARNNSQHCCTNNVGRCCARLHAALERVDCTYFSMIISRVEVLSTLVHIQKKIRVALLIPTDLFLLKKRCHPSS